MGAHGARFPLHGRPRLSQQQCRCHASCQPAAHLGCRAACACATQARCWRCAHQGPLQRGAGPARARRQARRARLGRCSLGAQCLGRPTSTEHVVA